MSSCEGVDMPSAFLCEGIKPLLLPGFSESAFGTTESGIGTIKFAAMTTRLSALSILTNISLMLMMSTPTKGLWTDSIHNTRPVSMKCDISALDTTASTTSSVGLSSVVLSSKFNFMKVPVIVCTLPWKDLLFNRIKKLARYGHSRPFAAAGVCD